MFSICAMLRFLCYQNASVTIYANKYELDVIVGFFSITNANFRTGSSVSPVL